LQDVLVALSSPLLAKRTLALSVVLAQTWTSAQGSEETLPETAAAPILEFGVLQHHVEGDLRAIHLIQRVLYPPFGFQR
jgi:hypothetical protein